MGDVLEIISALCIPQPAYVSMLRLNIVVVVAMSLRQSRSVEGLSCSLAPFDELRRRNSIVLQDL